MNENAEQQSADQAADPAQLPPMPAAGDDNLFPDVNQEKTPLHRVIDVPLAVTIRFGQRHLSVRELLELSTGSLVELDRQVEEPVDLMLGERVVARGEVVIIDGNYGMRVTEVIEMPPAAWHGRAPVASLSKPPTAAVASTTSGFSAHG